jgi:D-alanine--poly(phosphoribitol) ligase subunit 1
MKYNFHTKNFDCVDENATQIAIAASDADITWLILKNKVEEFAASLTRLNIPSGHPVIIYGHKELLFPVSILACIHAGITYVPVDIVYPIERIKKIQQITGSQICINCTDIELDVDFSILIDSKCNVFLNESPSFEKNCYPLVNDILQYIIFTSGSTGEPKGVQISYSSVLAFVKWAEHDFAIKSSDVIMSQALFSFDLSLWDMLVSLSSGATLVLMSEQIIKNQEAFINRLVTYNCTIWSSTPSFVFMFLRNPLFNAGNIKLLQRFYMMGETLSSAIVNSLKKSFPINKVFNAYGPTETTIITSMLEITEEIINRYTLLPVGYKMPNSDVWIDLENNDSKYGEIYIAGNHVSVGYLKNEELNKQKYFIHNHKRAFKTGDIGYYENGMLFIKERADDQIKLHGYRIELNEINAVLCKYPYVVNAVTLPLKRNNEVKKIVSFVVTDKKDTIHLKEELINVLQQQLPQYMIPGDIIFIDELPYTINHKIDKNKLLQDYLNKMLQ